MRIVIDLDDKALLQDSEDINEVDYTPAVELKVDFIDIEIKPKYRDGHEILWLSKTLYPDEDNSPHIITIYK